MGIFGENAEISNLKNENSVLQSRIDNSKNKYAKIYEALQTERAKSALLTSELASLAAQLAKAKTSVVQARKRQKASVERANRFKEKLHVD